MLFRSYTNSPKAYHYRAEKVQLLKVQSRLDPSQVIITVDGNLLSQVDVILDFGPFYRFLRTGKKALTYPKSQVELLKNCLTNQKQAGVFEYFKEIAAAVSLVAEGGLNILSAQYERIKSVSDVTVLSCYLDSSKKPAVRALPEAVIYPFGLNQSQKTATEFSEFFSRTAKADPQRASNTGRFQHIPGNRYSPARGHSTGK